jgi:repressor LexA
MGRPETTELTARQRQVFEWVKAFIREHTMPPTVREIGRAFHIESSSVFDLLKTLERKNYIRRGDRGARSLIVEGMRRQRASGSDVVEVAIVGRIPAGQPIEAIEHDCGTVAVKRDLLRGREAYALKVEGQSMVEAGILDGDYVIVRKQQTAEDGDIVVALIENEATLKRFYRDGAGVRLEPANSSMRPIHVQSGEFRIQGKVVGVQRIIGNCNRSTGG